MAHRLHSPKSSGEASSGLEFERLTCGWHHCRKEPMEAAMNRRTRLAPLASLNPGCLVHVALEGESSSQAARHQLHH